LKVLGFFFIVGFRKDSFETTHHKHLEELSNASWAFSETVTLKPLSPPEIESLVTLSFGVASLDLECLAFLAKRSRGNPRSCLDLMNDMLSQEILFVDTEADKISMQKNLEEVDLKISSSDMAQAVAAFDGLTAHCQAVLKGASVAGAIIYMVSTGLLFPVSMIISHL
jgi:hypothetical protein